MSFSVIFTNEDRSDFFEIPFQTHPTALAQSWLQLLAKELSRGKTVFQRDRLSNFHNLKYCGADHIKSRMRAHSDTINSYFRSLIPENLVEDINEKKLHQLHRIFENYCRDLESGKLHYPSMPAPIHQAFCELNACIHHLESIFNSPAPHHDPLLPQHQEIVVGFKDEEKWDLHAEDYDQFTLQAIFGDVYLDYAHWGRHLWEALVSGDSMALETNLKIQTKLAAGFRIWFGKNMTNVNQRLSRYEKWLAENASHILNNGISLDHPATKRPGFAKLASIEPSFAESHSPRSLIDRVGGLGFVDSIKLS